MSRRRRRTRRLLAASGVVLLAAALAACSGTPGSASTPTPTGPTFENPVLSAGADPWVVRWRSAYLLVESRDGGIWIRRSPADDLTGIASGTETKIWSYPADGPNSTDVWAPELHRIGDRWYVYYAATAGKVNAKHRMFVLESTSSDPLGSYVDRGKIADAADRWAIDGTRFTWKGRAYFVWSGWPAATDGQQNLYIALMRSPTELIGTGVLLSSPTLPFERHGMPVQEGPEALEHGGRLFLVYSASGSWTDDYCLGMLSFTGTDPLDPHSWTKRTKPVFARTTDVSGPGHASFTTSPDGRESWIVYHSARYPGAGWDRVVDAQRFTWRADGSPDFGRPIGEGVPQALPSGQPAG